jgi:hypothetical protein
MLQRSAVRCDVATAWAHAHGGAGSVALLRQYAAGRSKTDAPALAKENVFINVYFFL